MKTLRWTPPPRTDRPRVAVLTPRQTDVLHGICLGLTNNQIGRRLDMSEETVKVHVRRLLAAMHTGNRADAAILVYTGTVTIAVRDETRQPAA